MILALICCPEVQVLAARGIGNEEDEPFAGVPKGEIGEVCSLEERKKRAYGVQDVPEDPYSAFRRNRGSWSVS
eukprot:7335080-Alexandrium_andersonii.AAC.1